MLSYQISVAKFNSSHRNNVVIKMCSEFVEDANIQRLQHIEKFRIEERFNFRIFVIEDE